MPTTVNPWELAGREKKASALIEAIDLHGYAGLVNHMEPIHWESVAKEANINPPSPETIQLVRDRINRRWMQQIAGGAQ